MCASCRRDWRDEAALETFDPIADDLDTKRHARERAERAAAGIPEPTIAELGQMLGEAARVDRAMCVQHTDERATEGPFCASCAEWRFGEAS